MGVTKYKCFVGYGNSAPKEIREIGVLEISPVAIKDDDLWLPLNASGVSDAIAIAGGRLNRNVTLVGFNSSSYVSTLESNGACNSLYYNGVTIIVTLPNGNYIRITENSIAYCLKNKPASGIYEIVQRLPSVTNTISPIVGFISKNRYSNDFVAPTIVYRSDNKFSLGGNFNPYNFPHTDVLYIAYYAESSSPITYNRINRNEAQTFFTNFWNVDNYPDLSYGIVTVNGAGGSVTPTSFFSTANEPRMFTATPDAHHAIHSVNIYSLKNDALIPYQESAMDLLTGAKSYIFTMPANDVRIVVDFHSIEITIPVTVSYTHPTSGKVYTTSFSLLYDNSREEGG